jgi:YVTN family beta-propeller protein
MRWGRSNRSILRSTQHFSAPWIPATLGASVWISTALAASTAAAAAEPPIPVYVTTSSNVSVVNAATDKVSSSIPATATALAVTPNGTRLYATTAHGVDVINTATNKVLTTVSPIGSALAITPNGKQVYVLTASGVAVINTATNTVATTVKLPAGSPEPTAITIAPNGGHAYLTGGAGVVSLLAINTTTHAVATAGSWQGEAPPESIAITPDGAEAYVVDLIDGTRIINLATGTVAALVPEIRNSERVAIAPDGKHAYVTNLGFNPSVVQVIDTATKAQSGTIQLPAGAPASGPIAITPDGEQAFVSTFSGVEVLSLATDAVIDTIAVTPTSGLAIAPSLPFASFGADVAIESATASGPALFQLIGSFTLGSGGSNIDPASQPVVLQIGTFTTTVPSGSFKSVGTGAYTFSGTVGGVALNALIVSTGGSRYAVGVSGQNASFAGTTNPVPVTLTIGNQRGSTTTQAVVGGVALASR